MVLPNGHEPKCPAYVDAKWHKGSKVKAMDWPSQALTSLSQKWAVNLPTIEPKISFEKLVGGDAFH